MTNFKNAGQWWNDKNIELVEIDSVVYALNGWNGEKYLSSWICTGEGKMDASEEEYTITPISVELTEDEFKVIDYEVARN